MAKLQSTYAFGIGFEIELRCSGQDSILYPMKENGFFRKKVEAGSAV